MNAPQSHNTSLGKNGTDRYGFIGDGSESSTFNGSHNNYYYTGSVDEIRLWNYARSSAEIQENRGKRLTGCNAGLVLYYDFNEGGGTGFYGKATHTFARFNGAISRETVGAPLPNCASPSFESDPLLVGLSDYRYGFNGKEMDNEVSGKGNQYDYGFRIYNPRLGRFLSTDPIGNKFPFYSPYHFAGNRPIVCLDMDGLEDIYYGEEFEKNGSSVIQIHDNTDINNELDQEFSNTDPDIGNQGWDMLIIAGEMPNGENGFTYKVSGEDVNARGYSDEYISRYEKVTEKVFSNPQKKGLIVVVIDENAIKEANRKAVDGSWQDAGDVSHTVSHEKRIHVIPLSRGAANTAENQNKAHGDYHRNPDGHTFGAVKYSPTKETIRTHYQDSPAGKDLKATDNTVKSFENSNKVYLSKVESKPAESIDR